METVSSKWQCIAPAFQYPMFSHSVCGAPGLPGTLLNETWNVPYGSLARREKYTYSAEDAKKTRTYEDNMGFLIGSNEDIASHRSFYATQQTSSPHASVWAWIDLLIGSLLSCGYVSMPRHPLRGHLCYQHGPQLVERLQCGSAVWCMWDTQTWQRTVEQRASDPNLLLCRGHSLLLIDVHRGSTESWTLYYIQHTVQLETRAARVIVIDSPHTTLHPGNQVICGIMVHAAILSMGSRYDFLTGFVRNGISTTMFARL